MKTWRQIILFLLPENAPSHFTYARPMVQWSSIQKISERLGCWGGNPRGQNRFHQSMAYNSTNMIIYNSTGNKRTKEPAAMIFHMKYFKACSMVGASDRQFGSANKGSHLYIINSCSKTHIPAMHVLIISSVDCGDSSCYSRGGKCMLLFFWFQVIATY